MHGTEQAHVYALNIINNATSKRWKNMRRRKIVRRLVGEFFFIAISFPAGRAIRTVKVSK